MSVGVSRIVKNALGKAVLAALIAVCSVSAVSAADSFYFNSKSRFVFIGDSYGTPRTGAKEPWPVTFTRAMGIDPAQTLNICKGAHGFAKPTKQFITVINSRPVDKKVTDVVIIGGIGNDWSVNPGLINKRLNEFNAEVRRRFPNARIVYGYPNWNDNQNVVRGILAHEKIYQDAAKRFGWVYLSGMEKMLRGNPAYFLADGHHPTQAAQVLIGKKMASLYKKYCVSGVKLSTYAITTRVGINRTIKASVTPSTAQKKGIEWYSLDPKVAKVSKNGVVTGVGKGITRVYARSVDGRRKAYLVVKVLPKK